MMTFEAPRVTRIPPPVINLHRGCPLCGGSLIDPNDPDELCPNRRRKPPEEQTPWHREQARVAWKIIWLIVFSVAALVTALRL